MRLLLDTNIYGLIIIDDNREKIHNMVHTNKNIDLYGFDVVRKELRSTKRAVININLRMDLLRIYDELVKKSYTITSEIKKLAEQYYDVYQEIGGTMPKEKLTNDFLIIACASIKNLDIVVSNDTKTMFNELQTKAYSTVNKLNKIKLPDFISYEDFKNVIKK